MRLTDFLNPYHILMEMKATTKKEALEELVRPLAQKNQLPNPQAAVKILLEREALSSTGIGQGVAIPHARWEGLEDIIMVLGLSTGGVNFNAQDGHKTHIFFLIMAPPAAGSLYLQILARTSRLLKNEVFCRTLRQSHSKAETVWQLLEEQEKAEAPLR